MAASSDDMSKADPAPYHHLVTSTEPHADRPATAQSHVSTLSTDSSIDDMARAGDGGHSKFMPISTDTSRPGMPSRSGSKLTEDDIFRALTRRRTSRSSQAGRTTTHPDDEEERAEIELLMSRMFGRRRQEHSEEE